MERDKKSQLGDERKKESARSLEFFSFSFFLSGGSRARYATPLLFHYIFRANRVSRDNAVHTHRENGGRRERGGKRRRRRTDINSGLDASLIVHAANDSAISAIADNGGALDEN